MGTTSCSHLGDSTYQQGLWSSDSYNLVTLSSMKLLCFRVCVLGLGTVLEPHHFEQLDRHSSLSLP